MTWMKFVLISLLVLCMITLASAADEFNRTGTDIIVVGNGLIDYGF